MRLTTVQSVEHSHDFAQQVKTLSKREHPQDEIERLRTQLLALTPRAVLAQVEMDRHKHGYHNREKRLYELIDFNDSLVSLVLATPNKDLTGLDRRLKRDMTAFCRRLNTPMFTDEQFEAIVRGLSREIAVFRAARYLGYDVHMTSRIEDAFGIDMVIQDAVGRRLNIDCKTPAAFRHRLEDLLLHRRINNLQLLHADEAGYVTVEQRRGHETVPVTLMCILPDRLGEIHDFTFDQPERLKHMLETMFSSLE